MNQLSVADRIGFSIAVFGSWGEEMAKVIDVLYLPFLISSQSEMSGCALPIFPVM
jgi:hypothetical protein